MDRIEGDIRGIKENLEKQYVTQDQFEPVKNIVYGMVTLILIAVAGGSAGGKLAAGIASKFGPKAAKVAKFIGESVGSTAGVEAPGGDLQAKDVGIGLGIDTAISSLFNLSPASKIAFQGVKKLGQALKGGDEVIEATTKEVAPAIQQAGKNLERADIDVPGQNLLKELPDELRGFAEKALGQAKQRSERIVQFGEEGAATPIKEALDLVGDDVKSFQKEIGTLLGSTGKAIKSESSKLKEAPPLSTSRAYQEFINTFDDLGIRLEKGKLTKNSFKDSQLDGLVEDQNMIMDIFNYAKPSTGTMADIGRNPFDALNKLRNIGHKIYKGKGEITASKRPAEVFRSILREDIEKLPGKYGEEAKKYSELLNLEDELARMVGDEGEKSAQFIRRLYGRAPGQAKSTIESIEEAAHKYGIESGKNITGKTAIAEFMDRSYGGTPPQSFQGQTAEGVKKGIKAVMRPLEFVADTALGQIFKKPEQIQAIQEFIEATADPVAKKEATDILAEVLSAVDKANPASPILRSLRALVQAGTSE